VASRFNRVSEDTLPAPAKIFYNKKQVAGKGFIFLVLRISFSKITDIAAKKKAKA
jgi:hypothetical protein